MLHHRQLGGLAQYNKMSATVDASSVDSETKAIFADSGMHGGTAVVTINHNGIILSVDKSCCDMFGYELTELVNANVTKLIPAPYKEQHDSYVKSFLTTGVKKVIGNCRQVEAQHKNGTIFPIRLSVSELTINVPGMRMFCGLIKCIPEDIATVVIDSKGSITGVNNDTLRLFGYKSAVDLVGQNVKLLCGPSYKENHDKYIQRYLRTGIPRAIGTMRAGTGLHKDGTVFPLTLDVEELPPGRSGRAFRGRLHRVNDDVEAVFTITNDGKIISCNHTFVQSMFGYRDFELLGKNVTMLVPELAHDVHNEPIGEGEEGGSSTFQLGTRLMQCRHRDGTLFPVLLKIDMFECDDVSTGYKHLFSARIQRRSSDDLPKRIAEMMDESPHAESKQTQSSQASNTSASSLNFSDLPSSSFFVVCRTLGRGANGVLIEAIAKADRGEGHQYISQGEHVAIKVVFKTMIQAVELERTRREVAILRRLRHPNVVRFIEAFESVEYCAIVLELCAGGELYMYIRMFDAGLSEHESHRLFQQIVSAVSYCHSNNVIHRDIKHKNIMLSKEGDVRLIDFGLSNYIPAGDTVKDKKANNFEKMGTRKTFCGTPAYAAPEMLLGTKYHGPEVDVWSMGVVLYSMVLAEFPFSNVNHIVHAKWSPCAAISEELIELFNAIFKVKMSERATVDQVAQHKWVAQFGQVQKPKGANVYDRFNFARVDALRKQKREEERLKKLQKRVSIIPNVAAGSCSMTASSQNLKGSHSSPHRSTSPPRSTPAPEDNVTSNTTAALKVSCPFSTANDSTDTTTSGYETKCTKVNSPPTETNTTATTDTHTNTTTDTNTNITTDTNTNTTTPTNTMINSSPTQSIAVTSTPATTATEPASTPAHVYKTPVVHNAEKEPKKRIIMNENKRAPEKKRPRRSTRNKK